MNYKDFFLNNNKSGWKCVENKLKNTNPDIHDLIINYAKNNDLNNLSYKEKIYHFINEIPNIPTCKTCGNKLKFGRSIREGYPIFCSNKCSDNDTDRINKIQKKLNEKFNGSYFLTDDFKRKSEETMLCRYGVKNAMLSHDLKYKRSNNINERFLVSFNELNILHVNGDNIRIICDKCGKEYTITRGLLWNRKYLHSTYCLHCNPYKSNDSSYANEILEYLISNNLLIEKNNRKILNGKELDIFIPKYNVAIEFDGLYWHSELFKDKNYHLNKTLECNNKGIKLIHIFEDEWIYKKNIVKSRLKNILGLNTEKIFARKCDIKIIDNEVCKSFLINNHIQGDVSSQIKLGLYYYNELVSLMTFNNGRIIMSGKPNEYELTRFCNKLNTNVIGGASKLLKHFINNYKPKNIISYADMRWSNGDLYEKLGFTFIHNSIPNYWYVIGNTRQYRFNYRKSCLIKQGFDSNKTEHQIMLERNIYRIYDCGTKRYELFLK